MKNWLAHQVVIYKVNKLSVLITLCVLTHCNLFKDFLFIYYYYFASWKTQLEKLSSPCSLLLTVLLQSMLNTMRRIILLIFSILIETENATECVESFKWEFLQFLKLIRENGVDGGEKGYKSVWRGGWNLTTTFIPNNGGSDCILCIPRWLLATSKDGWGRGRCPFSQSQLIPIHIGVVIVSYVIRNLLLSMSPPLCFLSHLSESFSFISLSNFTSFSQLLISFYRIISFLFSFQP